MTNFEKEEQDGKKQYQRRCMLTNSIIPSNIPVTLLKEEEMPPKQVVSYNEDHIVYMGKRYNYMDSSKQNYFERNGGFYVLRHNEMEKVPKKHLKMLQAQGENRSCWI